MTRIAVCGGVYSNPYALSAFCEDARRRGADQLYCLGDLGGYGAEPDAIWPLLLDNDVTVVAGNYDVASALIKSIRGSAADAALHYLARMLEAGEDPRFIARRIVISASEDVGMGDPTALQTAVAAMHAVAQIGMPEARIILAQAVVHNAMAPKSNAAYLGINEAIADVRAGRGGVVPAHLRGSGYAGAERLGHGKGYVYAHDEPDGVAAQQYLPDDLHDEVSYYRPTDRGFEARLRTRWEWLSGRLGRTRRQ